MDELEFKKFDKILPIGHLYMSITQKIHGTNAHVNIFEDNNGELQIKAASTARYITPEDDNYGFARFVADRKNEFIEFLGKGRHYGEWCGIGINSGEGLDKKMFLLFNWRRWIGKNLPMNVGVVPLLYKGVISIDAIQNCMQNLKEKGSFLVPGYMKPEGIVIELDGQFYKNVFDNEETKWNEKIKKINNNEVEMDISHLLQPIRLEKLLSREESYLRDYPQSLGKICTEYVKDLEEEKQFVSIDPDLLKKEKKVLGRHIFYFVKSIVSAVKGR